MQASALEAASSRRPRLWALGALAGLAGLGLLVAGCGGSGSPGVADLATTSAGGATTQATSPAASPSLTPATGGSGGGSFAVAMKVGADGAKFSSCMRAHGLASFPDPNGQGVISFGSSSGINPASPVFQHANAACRKVLPNGGVPTPAEQAQARAQALKFSVCMRAHGVPNFPDPPAGSGNVGFHIRVGGNGGFDPSSPRFQAAQSTCARATGLPAKLGPLTAAAGPK